MPSKLQSYRYWNNNFVCHEYIDNYIVTAQLCPLEH